jgi:type III pantothenate kinase
MARVNRHLVPESASPLVSASRIDREPDASDAPSPTLESSPTSDGRGQMLLVVDVGNSQVKLGRSNRSGTTAKGMDHAGMIDLLGQVTPAQLREELMTLALPDTAVTWRVISVAPAVLAAFQTWIRRHRPHDLWLILDYRDLPLSVQVEHPDRVGMDRLAAAVGANLLRAPDEAAIVIDAGTAVTVDAVDRSGAFLGGLILPGPRISARTLAANTAQLPDVMFDPADLPPIIGRNTVEAIRGGIYWGMLGALELILARLKKRLESPARIFVTGGAIASWAAELSESVTVVPELVLIGVAAAQPRRHAEPIELSH